MEKMKETEINFVNERKNNSKNNQAERREKQQRKKSEKIKIKDKKQE